MFGGPWSLSILDFVLRTPYTILRTPAAAMRGQSDTACPVESHGQDGQGLKTEESFWYATPHQDKPETQADCSVVPFAVPSSI